QQPFDFFLQANARWYSLHGVDLLSAPLLTELSFDSRGGYQRLFAFTGSLGRHPLQQGRAAIRLAVMWLTQDELPAAGESFSVKFADIVRRHRVLDGNDPFDRFTVARHAAIARVRQVLLNLVLRLRASFALESDREERLPHPLADLAGPLRASAAEILDLKGTPASNSREALELLARQLSPTTGSTVRDSLTP